MFPNVPDKDNVFTSGAIEDMAKHLGKDGYERVVISHDMGGTDTSSYAAFQIRREVQEKVFMDVDELLRRNIAAWASDAVYRLRTRGEFGYDPKPTKPDKPELTGPPEYIPPEE